MSARTILLVDDEEIILASIGWVLEKNNFKVTTATSGQEAIDLLREKRYDLVITDLVMAKVDGMAILQLAKSLYSDIGVIILTGQGNVGSAVRALQLGADDYLQKPCDIDELINKANRSFEKQDLMAKLREQNELLKNEVRARKVIEVKLQEFSASLERQVTARTAELTHTVGELNTALDTLLERDTELREKNRDLHDLNTTLTTMLKRRDQERNEMRKEIAAETVGTVLPLLKKAQNQVAGPARDYLETAEANLLGVFAEHPPDIVLTNARLAPRELQIVHYIRQGKSSKEIADLLELSVRTVESYRENIRKKLRITNKKKSLKKFLISLP